jgi:hypothetical protein
MWQPALPPPPPLLLPLLQQVADYESLIRRVMRRAPQAALMSFAIFGFNSYANVASSNSKPTDLPSPW